MTSTDIRVDAQLLTGFQINDVTAFLWTKDAIKKIYRNHPLAAPKKTVEVSFTDEHGGEYVIEDELVRIEDVTRKDHRYPIAQHTWDCDEFGNMKFWHKGEYVITYRYVPPMPPTISSPLSPLPDRYAECIKYYVSARMRSRVYGQGDNDAQTYDNLFWQYVADADISMERTNKRHRRMPARI